MTPQPRGGWVSEPEHADDVVQERTGPRRSPRNHEALRQMLLDDDDRDELFPDLEPELRSRPTSKTLRIGLGGGIAEISIAPRGDGRVTIAVAHTELSSPGEVARWKAFWGDWIGALDEA